MLDFGAWLDHEYRFDVVEDDLGLDVYDNT